MAKEDAPSAPVESPQVSDNNKTQSKSASTTDTKSAKKAVAEELTPAQKAAKTRAAAKKSPSKRDPKKPASDTNRLSVEEVAEQILAGSQKWMSGRERDILLSEEGYDLDEVRNEIAMQRAKNYPTG